jgi:hypothetical protein
MLFEIMSAAVFTHKYFELYISLALDNYVTGEFIKFETSEYILRSYIASFDLTLFTIFHPEVIYIEKTIENSLLTIGGLDLYITLYDFIQKNSLVIPVAIMFQLLAVFFILLFGLIFFLSFFSSNNKESWASSLDHTFSNGSIEAEKELFSAEDVLFLFNSIFFIFGSYFYFLAMSLDMSYTEFTIFYYAIPLLVLSLLWIPINLLYDFGLLFNLYLRGSTNTSNFFFELIFDYIGIVAFFTRLLVQFVRLILMMVVYCMMHDAIVLNTSYNKTLFINVDL